VLILAAIVAIFIYGMIARHARTHAARPVRPFPFGRPAEWYHRFVQALGLILASLAVGPLLDNEGKEDRTPSLGSLDLDRTLRAAAVTGFRSILFLLFLLGVGGGIVVTGANALVSDVSPTHRATALNLVNLFLRTRRTRHPVHRRESFQAKLGAPVLHHCVAYRGHTGDSGFHQLPGPTGAGVSCLPMRPRYSDARCCF